MEQSDHELLAAWRAGDDRAGNALVKRYFKQVYRFFRNKVSGQLDDLVQATFTRCVKARDTVRDDASFPAFLFAIARNVVREYYREKARKKEVDFGSKSVADMGMTPTGMLVDKEDYRLLLAALRSVPLEEQVILELFYWEKMTGRQLAEVLAVPEGTARTRLRAARQSLEAALAELARSPELLQSTMDNLEKWSESIRESLAQGAF